MANLFKEMFPNVKLKDIQIGGSAYGTCGKRANKTCPSPGTLPDCARCEFASLFITETHRFYNGRDPDSAALNRYIELGTLLLALGSLTVEINGDKGGRISISRH